MIADFFNGARYPGQGWQLIKQPGLRRFVAIPLLINILIFIGFISVGYHYYWMAIDWLTPDFFRDWKDDWLIGWLISIIEFFLWFMFGAAALIAMTYTFILIASFIAAPFNSLLAEKVEHYLTGTLSPPNASILPVLKSLPKTLASEVYKLVYLMMWMIPLLVVSLIPVLNFLSPMLWLAFGAWMLTLEYLDYPMGNHNYRFAEIKTFMRSHRGFAMGFGGSITLMNTIPLINLIAMPVAVAAATKMWVEQFSQRSGNTQEQGGK